MIGIIAEFLVTLFGELLLEGIIYGFFLYVFGSIGVLVRKVFFFRRSFKKLWRQKGWNIFVGVVFVIRVVAMVFQHLS